MIAGMLVLIIVIVSAVGIIGISQTMNDQHSAAMSDPINNSGIQSGENVKVIDTAIMDNIPTAIIFAFLITVIIFVLLIFGILGRNNG